MVKVVVGTKVCSFEEMLAEYGRVCEETAKLEKEIEIRNAEIARLEDKEYKQSQRIAELESEVAVDNALLDAIKELRKEETLPFSCDECEEKTVKVNLNDNVKVKLTPYGAEIYYHQYDETNKQAGRTVIEPHMPNIDKDGYTSFQLHHFVNLYGEHIRMCNKNVIDPLDIILCD